MMLREKSQRMTGELQSGQHLALATAMSMSEAEVDGVFAVAPAITIRGVPQRGLYAKAASRRGLKLAEWCREALAEKLERESK